METGRITNFPSQPPATTPRVATSEDARPEIARPVDPAGRNTVALAAPPAIKNRRQANPRNESTERAAPQAEVSREFAQELATRIFSHINIQNRSLSFQVSQESGKTVVLVIDTDTDEIVRQIPSEELLRIARVIDELIDQRAAGSESFDAIGLLIKAQA